jgi:hypothetical protein
MRERAVGARRQCSIMIGCIICSLAFSKMVSIPLHVSHYSSRLAVFAAVVNVKCSETGWKDELRRD